MKQSQLEDVWPLSPLQEGFLFRALYDPHAVDVYHLQYVYGLDGPVDAAALKAAGQALLGRHANLRAAFWHPRSGRPVQVIAREVTLPWREVDLSGLEVVEREAALTRLLTDDCAQRFDPAHPPLLRFTLVRLDPQHYRLVLTNHHILLDGWSMPVLMRELLVLYAQRGDPTGLPRVTPYRDYLTWLTTQDQAGAQQAWAQALAGLQQPTHLAAPGAGRAPVIPEHIMVEVPDDLATALHDHTRRHGVTLNTVIQATWGLLLGRLTGSQDVVFGATVAGRPPQIPGIETMVGLFINTLPVRVRLHPTEPLSGLLTRLQDEQSRLTAHQHLGLTDIQRLAGLGELFDTLTVFQNYPRDPDVLNTQGTGLRITSVTGESAPHYPLSLRALPGPGPRLRLKIYYRTDVFDQTRMRGLLGQLVYLLEQFAEDPDRPLDGYSLVSADSLVALPDPAAPVVELGYPLVSKMIDAWVRSCPQAIALEQGDRAFSYAQLRAWADGVVAGLAAQGLDNGDVVAVFGPPSPGLVAAMVAVVSSRGVLLTLDRRLPGHRLQVMLNQSRAGFLIVVEEDPGAQPPPVNLDGLRVLRVDAASPTVTGPVDRCEVVPAVIAPGDPAYVFFTSGTTGVPKGVVGRHNSLSHFLVWQRDNFGITPGDRCAQLTGLSFDVVLRDVFLPLVSGATLCLPSAEDQAAEQMIGWLAQAGITCAHVVPTLAQSWLEDREDDADAVLATGLRYTFFAGEPLTDQLVARWRQACPHTDIVNLYGPSETTLATCWYAVPADPPAGIQPVGAPLPGTQALVLGPGERLCGVGEIGEIVVRSPYRSLGYLHPPTDNQPAFVPNPHTADPTDLLYRTGDQGRYRPDGSLEVLGRLDRQVKIRGVRIEPDEIAAVLATHPGVSQAVVATQTDNRGQPTLVAYLTTPGPTPPTRAQLRSYLTQRLPAVMMPGAFVLLDHIPCNVNGKVDWQALPPALLNNTTQQPHTPPRSPVEEALCAIWAQVLGVDRVGVHDDFFDLGGHSLLAMQVVSRVRSVLGVELAVRALFEAPTVAVLAQRVVGAGRARLALTVCERPGVVPLSFAQRRLWFLDQLQGGGSAYHIAVAVRLSGCLDPEALKAAIGDVVARHESLRTVFPQIDGVPWQQVLDVDTGAWVWDEVTEVDQAGVAQAVTEVAGRGFDLATEAPVRARLLVVGPDEHVLVLVVHHIAADGWSMGVLGRDLGVAYAARRQGEVPGWSVLPVQYADYTLWQHQLLGDEADPGSVIAGQLAYWTAALADLPEQVELSTDRVRPAVATQRGDKVPFRVGSELHRGLVELAAGNRVSLFMVIQAGLAALLSRLGAGTDIPIGSPIAGRTDDALDELVGFFVNTLVLRTDTSGDPSFAELLARVRETDLGAYAHQDLPFERLVEVLNPARSLSRHPLFQVMLVLQNTPQAGLMMDLPGLVTRREPINLGVAEFDLSVSLRERRGRDGTPEGIDGVIEYSTDLFDRATVESMPARLVRLWEAVVADPDRPISRIEILTTEERHRLLVDYNNTTHPVIQACLPALFETQVQATPEAVAVAFEDTTLTYSQLNAKANQLAHALIGRGVGPEQIVALALPRSPELVVSILAVLKAGAAYLPVDPDYPAARIGFMLHDAQPALLLTDTQIEGGLPDTGLIARLVIDHPDTAEVLSGGADDDPTDSDRTTALRPQHPAYVIYTSGSTGQPKAVVVCHRSVANLFYTHREGVFAPLVAKVGGRWLRVAQTASFSFDTSWGGLLWMFAGHELHVVDEVTWTDPDGLVAYVARQRIDCVADTSSYVQLLVSHGLLDGGRWRPALVGVGAEAVSEQLWSRLRSVDGVEGLNFYGPTECTVDTLMARIDHSPRPVIGRPITNTRVYVLDAGLQLVPPGVTGELYIGGAGLARGYLHQPGLTAQRFVADPYGPAGTRLYRTGDLVRWNTDGNLEFLGRADDQVKIRGFRIEPREIETVLAAHPDIAQAAVIARQDRPDDKRLVAYVVPTEQDAFPPDALRDYLRQRLPEYMVPAAFVALDGLPLTPHGKLDRDALPAPELGSAGTGREPRTPQEQLLAEAFAEVLGVAGVGIDDDFFDLGGHSLMATRLIAQVRTTLGVELGLHSLFEAPTVAGLAARLDLDDPNDAFDVILPLRSQGCHSPLFCIHPGGGISWSYCGLMKHLGPDYPIYAVQARGLARPEPRPTSIEQMAADYTDQIRKVQPHGPYHLLGWSAGGLIAHAVATELHQRGEQTALLAILDAYPIGALSFEEPPVPNERAILVRLVGMLGCDPESLESEPLTIAQVVDILRSRGSALVSLDEHHISAVIEIMINNGRLAFNFTPGRFHGNLLLFNPTIDRGDDGATPELWRPYIDGTIETHDITTSHDLMTQPGSLAQIGPILAAKLHDITNNTSPSHGRAEP